MSELEDILMMQIQQAGLPMPVREYRFHPIRKWRADFAYPDRKLLIEVEGGLYGKSRHTTVSGMLEDAVKYNEATKLGYRLLRFVSPQITGGRIRRGTKIIVVDAHEAVNTIRHIIEKQEAE